MDAVFGKPPVIGFTVTIEEAKVDFDLYESLYKASGNGATMTADQKKRYADLKLIFEGDKAE